MADEEFEKGFAAAMSDGDVVVESTPAIEETKEDPKPIEDAQAPIEEVKEEPDPQQRVEVIPGYTQEELEEKLSLIPKLQKALDTTNGTYGARLAEMSKMIEKLQPVDGDTKTEVKAKSVVLERLKAEYPDIAELLAEDLKVNAGDDGGEAVTKMREEFATRLNASDEENKELRRYLLQLQHPDFRKIAYFKVEDGIVKFPDQKFSNWLADQPREKFDAVLGSKDPLELSAILTEYKNSLKPVKTTTQALESAILPKGTNQPGRAMTDKEIEEAAFRAAMAED